MKKIQIIITGILILSLVTIVFAQNKKYKIGILQWHETKHDHEALTGFKEGIELSGIPNELDIQKTNGDEALSRQIIHNWKEQNVDLICTIGTNGTKWTIEEIEDIPIVFTAVTNPVTSGISNSWDSSGRNVTGTSNWIRSETLLQIFKKAVPDLKNLGVIYNPDNPVPLAEVTEADKICESLNITLKQAHIKSIGQIENSVKFLLDQGIDTLWIPREVLVYRNMDHVGKITQPKKIPVVSSTLQGIGLEGPSAHAVGIVAVTVDYNALGRLCVPAAVEILTKNKNPADIPIRTMSNYRIIINANAAEDIDYQIPLIFLAEANKVIKGYNNQEIVIAGTGDNQKLMQILAEAATKQIGGKIEVPDSIGSSGGIRALIDGKIDFARVARALKKDEQEHGLTYRLFAKAPVVFAVHPDVAGIENITTEEIIKIYSGEITNWNQLGYQLGKIYPINREQGDSSLQILNEKIPGFVDITEPVGKIFYSTPEAVDAVVEHKKTIGFVPLPSVVGKQIKILKVDGIYPSVENVQNEKYNLTVPFALVYKGQLNGLMKKFVEFLYSKEGQQIIIEMGAVPAR